jgi:hypothetical protein
MTVYETPNEPMGPVYDAQGNKWRKDENDEYWLKTTDSSALTWDADDQRYDSTATIDEFWTSVANHDISEG